MLTFFVDERAQEIVRNFFPENVAIESIKLSDDEKWTASPVSGAVIGVIALVGHARKLRSVLAGGPYARLRLVELDPVQPEAARSELLRLLMDELKASHRQVGEARAIAAQLRSEGLDLKTRLHEIENLFHALGNPQLLNALAWQPTGAMLSLASGQSVAQALPINVASLTAIDLWFPNVVMPVIDKFSVVIRDASGQAQRMHAVNPEMDLETGWVRFCLPEPLSGLGRDGQVRLEWSGDGSIVLGLGQPVPDPYFRAILDTGASPEETLALQAWQSLGGVRLPGHTPTFSRGSAVSIREAEFITPLALPRPEIFAMPMLATDHVTAAFWEREDVILVHPSRSGPACAIIRGVNLTGLSHISALVTVGHVRSPNLNFAIGVAPHGLADEDGLWQRRLGPWVTGVPAHGWGQVHCIPVEPVTGKADILLATSLAADVPNDFSWGHFRGFRFSRGRQAAAGVLAVAQEDAA